MSENTARIAGYPVFLAQQFRRCAFHVPLYFQRLAPQPHLARYSLWRNAKGEFQMTSAKHVMIVASAAALALAVAAAPTLARQPAPQPTAQEQPAQKAQASMVRGELMKVDTAAKTIAVKPADGPETTIRYDDKTVVTGAERGIEGLANTSGTQVSVTVSGEGAERLATAIRILPKM